MIFFGLLSLIQIWFLPGFVFISFFKKINFVDKIILSFPLSIVLNYILVFLLVIFGVYKTNLLILIIFLQIIFLIWFYRKKFNLIKSFNLKLVLNLNIINLLFLILFLTYLNLAISSIGEITFPGDPLGMWDKWAKVLAINKIPSDSMDYPLAYPILLSLTYVTIGNTEIEFFSRSVCLVYPIMIWAMMFRIFQIMPAYKNEIKFIIFFTVLLTLNQFRHTLYIGFVDPILVFSTIALGYILILNKNYNFKGTKEIILISFIAILPGLLKQTSLYLSLAFPLLYFISVKKYKSNISLKTIFLYTIVFFSILFPWYFYKFYSFYLNGETIQAINLSLRYAHHSETRGIFDVFADQNGQMIKSFLFNLKYGLNLVFGKFYLIILMLIIIGLNKNLLTKTVFFILVLPYFVLWSNIFANDARNFAFLLPAIALIMSVGFLEIINYLIKFLNKILTKNFNYNSALNTFFILGIIVLSIFILNEKRSSDVLFKKQYQKELKRTNYPDVNILLYNYFANKNTNELNIIMYHGDFNQLPKFKKSINVTCQDYAINYLKEFLENKFYYLFKIDTCSEKFMNFYHSLENKEEIFKLNNHILWKNN